MTPTVRQSDALNRFIDVAEKVCYRFVWLNSFVVTMMFLGLYMYLSVLLPYKWTTKKK